MTTPIDYTPDPKTPANLLMKQIGQQLDGYEMDVVLLALAGVLASAMAKTDELTFAARMRLISNVVPALREEFRAQAAKNDATEALSKIIRP